MKIDAKVSQDLVNDPVGKSDIVVNEENPDELDLNDIPAPENWTAEQIRGNIETLNDNIFLLERMMGRLAKSIILDDLSDEQKNEVVENLRDERQIIMKALGQTAVIATLVQDIETGLTEQKETINKLKEEIITDSLTGCFNERFWKKFRETNFNINRDNGRLALVCVDINNLKMVNDNLGHTEGDGLIVKMAEFLKKNLRSEDIIIRKGGRADEFVGICRSDGERHDFDKILVAQIEQKRAKQTDVDFAFGVALFDINEDSKYDENGELDAPSMLDNTFRRAELIMLEDKERIKKERK